MVETPVEESINPDKCGECGHKGFAKYKGHCSCSVCGRDHVKSGEGGWTMVTAPDEPHPRCGELVKAETPEEYIGTRVIEEGGSIGCKCGNVLPVDTGDAMASCKDCGIAWMRTREEGVWGEGKLSEYIPKDEPVWVCLCGLIRTVKHHSARGDLTCSCGRTWRRIKDDYDSPWQLVEDVTPEAMEKAVGEFVEKCEGKSGEGVACGSCGYITKLAHQGVCAVTCGCGKSCYRDSPDDPWKPLQPMNLDCTCGIGYRPETVVFRCGECDRLWKRETVTGTTIWREALPPVQREPKHLSCSCGWLHKDAIGQTFRCAECGRQYARNHCGGWVELPETEPPAVFGKKVHDPPHRFDHVTCLCGTLCEVRVGPEMNAPDEYIPAGPEELACSCGRFFRLTHVTSTGSTWAVQAQ
jgi:hypothetical protein